MKIVMNTLKFILVLSRDKIRVILRIFFEIILLEISLIWGSKIVVLRTWTSFLSIRRRLKFFNLIKCFTVPSYLYHSKNFREGWRYEEEKCCVKCMSIPVSKLPITFLSLFFQCFSLLLVYRFFLSSYLFPHSVHSWMNPVTRSGTWGGIFYIQVVMTTKEGRK